MRRLEALADSIMRFSGYSDPVSAACRNRNPALLRAFSARQRRDAEGYRVFNSLIDGYRALLFDLSLKCGGKSNSRVKGTSNLRDLMVAYQFPPNMAFPISSFLRRLLEDDALNEQTELQYFVEDR